MPISTQDSYDLNPGQDLNDNKGYYPKTVLVDNYSPYWLLLPDAGRYVPPYTSGAVLPLIHAQTNRAQWSNPPLSGVNTGAGYVTTAGFAHLTFVDVELAYVAGSSVPNSALSQQQSFSVAEGGSISQTLDFLAQGVRVDNPGGTAYTIVGTGLIIPPWTTAWLANFTTPFNTIIIQPSTNPNGTPNTTQGGPLVATFYAQQVTPNGGTAYVPPATKIQYIQSVSNNNASGTVKTLTLSLPKPAIAGDILVAVLAWEAAANVPTACSSPGFTQVAFAGGSVNSIGGYWVGTLIASGGEQNIVITLTVSGNPFFLIGSVAEFGSLSIGLAQSNTATNNNSASVTPISSPNMLIGVSIYESTVASAGTPVSTNTKINSTTTYNLANYFGIAISSLLFNNNNAETATITWSGGTALLTAALAAE